MKALASTAAVILATTAIHAADRYVSTDGEYGQDVEGAVCYTDLQTAVTAAQAGETVWVDDGFVCDSGINANKARINITNKAITLRSKSGLVDEAQGLGATIRGPGAFCADPDQARCINSVGSAPVIRGFVLENGYPSGNGGCVAGGGCRLVNCVIRNGKGVRGGGVSSASCENCVITNNVSTEMGGGIYLALDLLSCTIAHNRATLYGGGVGIWAQSAAVYSNCLIFCNAAGQEGGGIALRGSGNIVKAIDCMISNNSTPKTSGGGASCEYSSLRLTDCDIVGNIATNAAGGGLSGCVATDCRIVGNVAQSTGGTYTSGGGAYNCMLTNCVVSFNTNDCAVADKMYSCGGGANRSYLTDCRIVDNVVSNCFASPNSEDGNGGGIDRSYATNCLIAGNAAWAINRVASGNGGGAALSYLSNCVISNNWAVYRGAAVFNPGAPYTCYNCLIVGNRSDAPHIGYDRGMIIEGEWANTLATDPPKFYNCTIAGNYAPNYACINDAELYNCIVWDNDVPTELYANQVWCYNTCQKDQTAGENGNVNGNPNLEADFALAKSRPCADAGQVFDWMTAADDPRAKDLAGNDRIIGSAPDMGCFERPGVGFLMSVQ